MNSSLPPGCDTLPDEEPGSVALDVPELPGCCWWTEDGLVGITRGECEEHIGTLDWDDTVNEAQNMARAVDMVQRHLKGKE